jgi:hypothetical protein
MDMHSAGQKLLRHLHAFLEYSKVKSESWGSEDPGTFSDLKNSACTYSYRSCEVLQFFLPTVPHTDPCSPGRKMLWHLAFLLGVHTSTCMLWKVLQLFTPRRPHTNPQCAGQKMLRYFACSLGVLTSGVLQIWKKCQNIEDIRILTLFSYLPNSTWKYTQRTSIVPSLFLSWLCLDLCVNSHIIKPRTQQGRGFGRQFSLA